MSDRERDWSLSFVGCGMLVFYHLGVTYCLYERAPRLLRDVRTFCGSSSGALHCALFLAGFSLDQIAEFYMRLAKMIRKHNFGILSPFINVTNYIHTCLQKELPANIHQMVSGRLCISMTRVSDGKNVLVSHFQSREEVIDALICSSFIPLFFGFIPPTFRGERYVDGVLSNNVPCLDPRTTITVSPFYGEHDICPRIQSTNFLQVELSRLNMQVSLGNAYLTVRTFFSTPLKVLGELCLRGYLDAYRFLEENGMCEWPGPPPSLASGKADTAPSGDCPESKSLDLKTQSQSNGLVEHLRASMLPWDESLLDILSPRLIIVLEEIINRPLDILSRIHNSLPVRILSYVTMPCVLPFQFSIAMIQRFVKWLPNSASDILWLKWAVSKAWSEVVAPLLPVPRCSAPASRTQASQAHIPRTPLAPLSPKAMVAHHGRS
ncbi:1-acylglycerol-3-phosphate O-acyltransferase PNPLA3 [Echinops telfairi]|uniref:1-acylglycerol-3-phosphate O-acyltransferase PNPLA3 n=1 Tax=Echinops telfairi TaxID=9371 RepID=A0ABM0IIE2_ECHTE|nr:1-acylglycerol-3-phosphate O-acyltransferase PNPLA3 [Echinops telfairi]